MLNFGFLHRTDSRVEEAQRKKLRILVISNLPASSETQPLEGPIFSVDRDSLDEVVRALQPPLSFAAHSPTGPATTLAIDSLESLHPDEIYRRSETCERYRRLKRQLRGSESASAIQEIQGWSNIAAPPAPTTRPVSSGATLERSVEQAVTRENWFESVVAETESREQAETERWRRFVDELIRPLAVRTIDPNLDHYQAAVDRAIELEVRRILHDPRFRQAEVVWRGLEWLLRRIDTDSACELGMWNVPADVLAYDLCQEDDLGTSACYRRLVRETVATPGGKRWDLICPLHGFSNASASLLCLGRFISIAAAAESAVAVGFAPTAPPHSAEWTVDWPELRALSAAPFLTALVPRFLLRPTYGRRGGRVEQFAFEEHGPGDAGGVWGNPAWLAACAWAQSYEHEQRFDPTNVVQFRNLPTWQGPDDIVLSGERLMHEGEIAEWLSLGLTPVVAYRDSDQVQIHGFQSVARTPWRGRWS